MLAFCVVLEYNLWFVGALGVSTHNISSIETKPTLDFSEMAMRWSIAAKEPFRELKWEESYTCHSLCFFILFCIFFRLLKSGLEFQGVWANSMSPDIGWLWGQIHHEQNTWQHECLHNQWLQEYQNHFQHQGQYPEKEYRVCYFSNEKWLLFFSWIMRLMKFRSNTFRGNRIKVRYCGLHRQQLQR